MPNKPSRNNIFILGLDAFQLDKLKTIHDADSYAFHGLLDVDLVVHPNACSFTTMLELARQQLSAFPGTVDGIIAHWDFPTSILAPVLCRDFGIPAPPLRSVFKCEHKYWSRVEQQKSIPDCIPRFCCFDPFHDQALAQIHLDYPFWIKPVKSFSSQLGFVIGNADDFQHAIGRIRKGIGRVGDAFDEALQLLRLPRGIRASTGSYCIAEEIIQGVQAAPEGSMCQGEFRVHGIIDMDKNASGHSFDRLVYPSTLPARIQQRMINASERFLRHIGFDNGCFNAEFMWDQANDRLQLVEVNTRISQSHSDLFTKVDGMSNHEVAVSVALGRRPVLPHRQGRYQIAAKCLITHDADGIVSRIPDDDALRRLGKRFPGTHIRLDVRPGMRLSQTPNQGSYRYTLGAIYLGADNHDHLLRKYEDCLAALDFAFQPPLPPPDTPVGECTATGPGIQPEAG
ncbi:MAG: ATP-grasp domain-containing protein [Aquisalimonadaceae bacterium]